MQLYLHRSSRRHYVEANSPLERDNLSHWSSDARVEAGWNTSSVALGIVGGDEKGTQCLGYNWATVFLGYMNRGI
jgi:hypothetical protein